MSAVIGAMQVTKYINCFLQRNSGQHIVYWKYEPATYCEKLSSKETIHVTSVQDRYV